MRNCIVLLLFVLAGLGRQSFFPTDAATRLTDNHVPVVQNDPIDWVRTVDGWEPVSSMVSQPAIPAQVLHPALITAGQILASVFALLAFSPAAASENLDKAQVE